HKEVFLREKLRVIQKELGEQDIPAEAEHYRRRIEVASLPSEVRQRALAEVTRLEKMSPLAAELPIVRGYLDWLLELPWSAETPEQIDLRAAEKVLEQNHF